MLKPSRDYGYAKTLEGTQLRSGYYQPDNAIGYCHISNVMRYGQDYVFATYIGIESHEYRLLKRYELSHTPAFDFIPPMKKGGSVVVHSPMASIRKEFRSFDSIGHVGLNTDMAYISWEYDRLYEWDSDSVKDVIEYEIDKLGYALGKCKEMAEQEYEAKKQKAEDERHDWKHDESLIL